MLHCFEFVRITLTTHAWRLPLLDQNACYACTSAALTKAGCVLRCAGQGVVFKGVAKATSFVTLREAFSLPQTLTPEVFGWIPPQHRFCPTEFCRLFHTNCLMLVCRNLIVVVISETDYSEINDNDFVCRCIHSIRLNILLCSVQVQMFALSNCCQPTFHQCN